MENKRGKCHQRSERWLRRTAKVSPAESPIVGAQNQIDLLEPFENEWKVEDP